MSAILNAKSSRLKFARRMRVANTSVLIHREFQFLPLLLTFPPFFPSQHARRKLSSPFFEPWYSIDDGSPCDDRCRYRGFTLKGVDDIRNWRMEDKEESDRYIAFAHNRQENGILPFFSLLFFSKRGGAGFNDGYYYDYLNRAQGCITLVHLVSAVARTLWRRRFYTRWLLMPAPWRITHRDVK